MRYRCSRVLFLGGAILAFTVAVSAVGFWKYAHYRYGGMDLAIYTNVLHSLSFSPSRGEGEEKMVSPLPTERGGVGGWGNWYSSIQGSSYLGDHVEPILLLLIPFFHLWTDPRLLIIFQALALGLTAIPIFILLRTNIRERWAVVLTMLWLLNPLLWNAALFEFHALAFAPLFLLSAAYFYGQRRFWPFLFFLFFSLSVREDVALIVVMFGVVAFLKMWNGRREQVTASMSNGETRMSNQCRMTNVETSNDSGFGFDSSFVIRHSSFYERHHRLFSWQQWPWIATPIVFGGVWFLLATRIAAAHSPSGAYKFLVYYGWLRDAASHPLALLRHFLSIGNLDMVVGLLLPFLFLPLLRPRWLLLALPPLLQILLAEPGGSNVVIELHYGLLFLPALALASIEAIAAWRLRGEHSNASNSAFECLECGPRYSEHSDRIRSIRMFLQRRFPLPKPFAISLGIATYLAAAWLLGPFPGIANAAIRGASADERTRAATYDELLQVVRSRTLDTSGVSIAAGYAALPHIAARAHAYALPYTYLGVNQYAFAPYVLPEDLQYLLLDRRDAFAYAVQFPSVQWSAPYAAEGPSRLQEIIADGRFGIVAERDGIALLERDAATAASDGIDQRYLAPNHLVRGRLIIDSLRDIVVQFEE